MVTLHSSLLYDLTLLGTQTNWLDQSLNQEIVAKLKNGYPLGRNMLKLTI